MNKRTPSIVRFERYVEKTDACWNWKGSRLPSGYGRFSFGGDRNMGLAHRWSYQHFNGQIPEGYTVDHLCFNKSCVNPDHLDAVTQLVNNIRAIPRRIRSTDTQCANGHAWSAFAYVGPNGKKTCKECRRLSQQRYIAEKRVA